MDNNKDYIELVEHARLGSRQSLDILAQKVRGRLYAYVFRIMLQEDKSEDIVQESMLEMFKNLDNLDRADHFWPWLCKIAFNKVRRYYKNQYRHKTVSISDIGDWPQSGMSDEHIGLNDIIGEELKQVVFDCLQKLKPKHRAVLSMRCYEEMQYSQIAQLMDSSEITARVLFYRAKEALHKQLAHKGLGKGFLMSALVLFGRMTAPSEAAVPSVTISAAATKVGVTAALVGLATSKTAVVTLVTAAVLAAGTAMVPLSLDKAVDWFNTSAASLKQQLTKKPDAAADVSSFQDEFWYYYPEKAAGPVMTRLIRKHPKTKSSYCRRFEDDNASYCFDKLKNTININNGRMWRDNLAVPILPTDKADLTGFLAKLQGSPQNEIIECVSSDSNGLLVIVDCNDTGAHPYTTRHYNVLDEEYFQHNWPAGTKIIDNRDEMHKRGWTFFRVTGHISGEKISGVGRIPFVYAAARQFYPWLKLRIADRLEITDGFAGAGVHNLKKRSFTAYRAGDFFKGLARPWMGLHTIDTIRRDAAEQLLRFETNYTPPGPSAEVIIAHERNKIVYTVNMEKDIVERITLLTSRDSAWETKAELKFHCLDDVEQAGIEFAGPEQKDYGIPQRESPGVLWLVSLAEDGLN